MIMDYIIQHLAKQLFLPLPFSLWTLVLQLGVRNWLKVSSKKIVREHSFIPQVQVI